MKKEPIFLAVGFCLAIVFRLWFITLAPQPFEYDQVEYEQYAAKIYRAPFFLAAHTYRSYPEPLLMATTYKLFGFGNHQALYVVHAILDAATAVMVFLILKRATKNPWIPWIGCIIYVVNPFTSGYVGTGLSENLDTFFITATIFCGSVFVKKPSKPAAILFGLTAGLAAQTRNAAFIWAGIPIALSLFWVPWKKYVSLYVLIAVGLILTTVYPLVTNWQAYREISITKVDSFYAMELFNGATLDILPPFTTVYPKAQQDMWREYWSEYDPNRTPADRMAMAMKYYKKAFTVIFANPWAYIRWRFFKMWYVWQKENVFFYQEPNWQSHRMIIYWGNTIILALAGAGAVIGYALIKKREGMWTWLTWLGTIGYGLAAFAMSHAEYRLTIPFYPVVLSLCSFGVVGFLTWIGVLRRKNH